MLEINQLPFPELVTQRLILRQVSIDDAKEIFMLRSNESVNALIDRQTATSIDEAVQFINKIIKIQNDGDGLFWVITLKDDPKLIGTIMYWNIVKEKDQAEVGYELLPSYHRKGIMQEALLRVIEFGFKTLGLKNIVAEPKAINSASTGLLEKCAFTKIDETDNGYVVYELNA